MGLIRDLGRRAWRLYVNDGVEATGFNRPSTVDIFPFVDAVEAGLSSLVEGLVIGGAVIYGPRSALYGDLAHGAGTLGVVYNDANPAYHGVYVKSGASGSGGWSITSLALPSTFAAELAALTTTVNTLGVNAADADANLFNMITTEASTRASAVTVLQSNINTLGDNAAAADVNLSDRIASVDSRIEDGVQISVNPISYAFGQRIFWAIRDSVGRVGAALTADGTLFAKLALRAGVAGNGIVVSRNANGWMEVAFGTQKNVLPLGDGGAAIDASKTRYYRGQSVKHAILDSVGRFAVIVTNNGVVHIPHLARLDRALDTAAYLFTTEWIGSSWQLFRTYKATGFKTQVTSIGNNQNPVLSVDGTRLLFATDRNGGSQLYHMPLNEATAYPVLADPGIVAYGDSLTWGEGASVRATDAFPAKLSSLLGGRVVENTAIAGNTSTQIAIRAGALQPLLTLSGNQIVAGANTVTAATVDGVSHLSGLPAMKGKLRGIRGTWSGSTFTPDGGQALPVSCPAGSAFAPDVYRRDLKCGIIWAGRNNYNDPTRVKTDVGALVALHKPYIRRLLILPVINGNYAGEYVGQSGYNTMMQLNADLAALYPDLCPVHPVTGLNLRQTLVAAYNPAIPQDVTDHGRDIVPSSLRVDNIHLTTAGYAIVAQWVYDVITARSW